MKRRTFLLQGGLLTTGYAILSSSPSWANALSEGFAGKDELYELFKNPPTIYRPFVRWWWNGDKV
jgi:hypothetical protein